MAEPTTAPVTAEGLRERIAEAATRWALMYPIASWRLAEDDKAELLAKIWGDQIANAVIAELAGDPGDLPARLAQAEAERDDALGQLSARRDHETRWETEKVRADGLVAERDAQRRETVVAAGMAAQYAQKAIENGERAEAAEVERDALKAAIAALLTAQGRMLDGWAEGNEDRRRELWRRLHREADRVRDALDGAHSPATAERIADEKPTGVHAFEQNPAATQISVCICGKWRDHHLHGADPCGCDACRTPGDAEELRAAQDGGK